MRRLVILAFFSFHALSNIYMGAPQYNGTGCPYGSAQIALANDQRSLSILFSNFRAEAFNPFQTARSDCNISIPLNIPSGYQVSIVKVDYRGYVYLPIYAQAVLSTDFFFAGTKAGPFQRLFSADIGTGTISANFLHQDYVTISTFGWSGCGEDVILRMNTSMSVTANGLGQQTLGIVDTADVSTGSSNGQNGVVFQLNWRSCAFSSAQTLKWALPAVAAFLGALAL